MLVKLMIAMAIAICVFNTGSFFSSNSLKNSISDKEIIATGAVIDKAIVEYYYNHSGELPDSLNADTLKILGLTSIDMSFYTYTKVSDKQFNLQATVTGRTISTAHSNQDLTEPYIEVK